MIYHILSNPWVGTWVTSDFMTSVVKRLAKYGGSCLVSAFFAGKIIGPLIGQLQKIKMEEIISDESIIRRFEQSLIEGEVKFLEESAYISDLIKTYFNIEGLAERLRTCRQEEKKSLWNDMKIFVFARLMTSIYLNYAVLIISKAEMILVAKILTKCSSLKDDVSFERCRSLMDELKGFYATLVAEICPAMIEVCKNVLEFTNLDYKLDDIDVIKTLLMQLKRRADASFSICKLMDNYYSSQLDPSEPALELMLYCKSHNFLDLLDYMICDGLDEIAINGFNFIEDNGKSKIMLSWITYLSAIFNDSQQKSLDDVMVKVVAI